MVVLSDVAPPSWRRLRISSGATLSRAVRVFTVAWGWPPGRPYLISVGSLRFAGPGVERTDGDGGDAVRLRQLALDPGAELEFEYGSGAPWHFIVRLERVLPPNDRLVTPWCLDGAGAAPPIDVGGPWGFEEWRGANVADTAAASDPTLRGLVPGFSLAWLNAQLRQLR